MIAHFELPDFAGRQATHSSVRLLLAGHRMTRAHLQVGSYFGLIPSEESSGGKQRLGKISKRGSSFLRFCWWKRDRRRRVNPRQNVPPGSREEIVYRSNNVIVKLTGVGKLRM